MHTASAGPADMADHTCVVVVAERDTVLDAAVEASASAGLAAEELVRLAGSASCHLCQQALRRRVMDRWRPF